MHNLEHFISVYGPLVVLVGTLLEGETIVVVAGLLAHQGVIDPYAVGICAFLGSFLGDQFWFRLGRRHADRPIVRRLARRPAFARATALIERHPKTFILGFRFVYGIRTISPVAVGLSRVGAGEFLFLNAIAAAIWAAAFTAIGYVFGTAAEALLGDIKAIEHKILLAAGAGALFLAAGYGARALWRRRRGKPPPDGKNRK